MLIWHRFKLTILRNYRDIVFTITSILVLATFMIVVISLEQTYKQSEQNERLLKGLSCILLILPEERTEQQVRDCIKDNGGNLNFEFISPPNAKKPKVSAYKSFQVFIAPPVQQGQPYKVLAVPDIQPKLAPKPPPEPSPTKKTSQESSIVLQKVYRISPTTGLREWRYDNLDMSWVVSNDQ